VGRESTTISEHATVAEALAEIDRRTAQMVRTGARQTRIELIMVDQVGRIIQRRDAH
jgi:hypothetical protein